jgi:hypothetical protein
MGRVSSAPLTHLRLRSLTFGCAHSPFGSAHSPFLVTRQNMLHIYTHDEKIYSILKMILQQSLGSLFFIQCIYIQHYTMFFLR